MSFGEMLQMWVKFGVANFPAVWQNTLKTASSIQNLVCLLQTTSDLPLAEPQKNRKEIRQ